MGKKVFLPQHAVTAVCLVLLFLSFYAIANRLFYQNQWLASPYEKPPYDRHIDEYIWYHYTYHYHMFFHKRSLTHSHWHKGTSSIGNTNMVKFLLGLFFDMRGVEVNKSYEKAENWWIYLLEKSPSDEDFKFYLNKNLYFSDQTLFLGRLLSAIFSYLALIVSVFYLIRVTNVVCGVIFVFVFGNLHLFYTTRMMADSYLLFFLSLSVFLFDWVVYPEEKRKKLLLIIIFSIVTGITMGIKLTGFIVITFFPIYTLVRFFKERDRNKRIQLARFTFIHLFITLAVFFLFHPQTYKNPVTGTYRFFELQFRGLSGEGKAVTLSTVANEFKHQIETIAFNIEKIFNFKSRFLFIRILVSLLIGIGVLSIFVKKKDASTSSRFIPILIVFAVFPATISYEWDERYTWFLTIIYGFLIMLGGNFLISNLNGFFRQQLLEQKES